MDALLGSGGSIGGPLTEALHKMGRHVRLVRRSAAAEADTEGITHLAADLTKPADTLRAMADCEVVYIILGLPYSHRVWRRLWPRVMSNVIAAAQTQGSKLVFLDNVYMYGRTTDGMTESTPNQPCSKKGLARTEVATMFMEAVQAGRITGLIARAPDFYGPAVANSVIGPFVVDRIVTGRRADWLGDPNLPHSFGYTPDIARALAVLGNDDAAYGRVWHTPTDPRDITGIEIMQRCAAAAGTRADYRAISSRMMRMLGLFSPQLREVVEMMYQTEQPYRFDSSDFSKAYFAATPYDQGLDLVIQEALTRLRRNR